MAAPTRTADTAVEQFGALTALPFLKHAFITRIPGIEVAVDKAAALEKLNRVHAQVRDSLGIGGWPLVSTEQVHGRELAVIADAIRDQTLSGLDGLLTKQPGIMLGIYVADCCAVFLVDPIKRAVGVVHSGKKGTELGIVPSAIELMTARFGSRPSDLVLQLSPCIRPPHYEIDFAATIQKQARAAGVTKVFDDGVCTACDLHRFYSYRAEKGRTGRMLALIGIAPEIN